MRAVLDGRDVLAVMPTGSGKSVGFQLPAVLLPGITLVVSPLIALMKDQVDDLTRRGIGAAALHSLMPAAARRDALVAARNGAVRLLYVAPERFASEHFVRSLVDDEARDRQVAERAHEMLGCESLRRDVEQPDGTVACVQQRGAARRGRHQ